MFLEYNVKAAMSFMQQTVMIGGVTRAAGTTSHQLKKDIKAAFNVDYTMPAGLTNEVPPTVFPEYRLMDSSYIISYSPSTQTGEHVSEKTMYVNCDLRIRARRPYLGMDMAPWRQQTEVKDCLSKLNTVVGGAAGTHGMAELWGYVPICRSDRDRVKRLIQKNTGPDTVRFFEGGDIPSTVYAAIGNYSFGSSTIPYLHTSDEIGSGFTVQTIGTLNQIPIDSTGQAARMALGISIAGDGDWYNTTCGRQNPGRITAGPLTTVLISEARTIVAASGENSIWESVDAAFDDDYEEDEDDYDEDGDRYR